MREAFGAAGAPGGRYWERSAQDPSKWDDLQHLDLLSEPGADEHGIRLEFLAELVRCEPGFAASLELTPPADFEDSLDDLRAL